MNATVLMSLLTWVANTRGVRGEGSHRDRCMQYDRTDSRHPEKIGLSDQQSRSFGQGILLWDFPRPEPDREPDREACSQFVIANIQREQFQLCGFCIILL